MPDDFISYFRNEMFELALVFGMTYEQYFFDDPQLFWRYKNAFAEKQKIKELELWKSGAYVLSALNSAVLNVNGFINKKSDVPPYASKPDFLANNSIQQPQVLSGKELTREEKIELQSKINQIKKSKK